MLRPPRPSLRALAAGLAAALLAGAFGVTAWAADPAHAAPATTEDPPAAEDGATDSEIGTDRAAELVVAPLEAVLDPTAEEYEFTVLVRNLAEEEGLVLSGGTVRLWGGTERIENRDQLEAFEQSASADGATGIGPEALLAQAVVEPIAAGEEQTLTVTVARDSLPLFIESGVYAVRAEFVADAATGANADEQDPAAPLNATTPILWRGPQAIAPVPLAMVVPFVLPSHVQTMPTRDDLVAETPRLDALLTAAEAWQATLAIDPRIIAGIRAYGTAAPLEARGFLARLEASSLPVFLLQFADADPAAQTALGFEKLLQPTGFGYITRLGTFEAPAEPEAPATDPDETAQPATEDPEAADATENGEDSGGGESTESNENAENTEQSDDQDQPPTDDGTPDDDPFAPGMDSLLSWPSADPGAWPAEGQANAATLNLLKEAGITSLVLSSDNVTGATAPRATVAGFDSLISDARLGADAGRALGGQSPAERAAGAAALLAELSLAADAESPGLVLALDRGAVAEAEAPAELLDQLGSLSWLSATPATLLPEGEAAMRDGAISERRGEMLKAAALTSVEINTLAPLLENPEYLTQYQRVRLLAALATRYASPEADLDAVERQIEARNEELLEGVQVLPSENTQLVGTQSQVPVLLHNALPFDARVTLRITLLNAAVHVTERKIPDQQVAAGSNTTVLVQVNSRVSSGQSGLTVQVTDREEEAIFSTATLRLTLRSSYETIMLVTLGSLAALLLGFGVWRSVRRHRRGQTLEPSDPLPGNGE
jgi:hypothetical protein